MKHCCERFEKATETRYPQIESNDEDKTWNVNGCCGGGCYVLEGLRFCPWCGSALQAPERNGEEWREMTKSTTIPMQLWGYEVIE